MEPPNVSSGNWKNEKIEAQFTAFCYIEEFPTMDLKKYFNQPKLRII